MSLELKTAVVTGASSGVGMETARMLAENGFMVVAAARRRHLLDQLAGEVEGVIPKAVDLSQHESVEEFCSFLANFPQPIDVLINNAGYSIRGAVEDLQIEKIHRLFQVNYFSIIRIIQACLPAMRSQRKGIIVNLSSMVGKIANPLNSVYSGTKHALEALSEALRLELIPFNIRVVVVRPGPIATQFHSIAKQWDQPSEQIKKDYALVYQVIGTALENMLAGIEMPGPEVVARLIVSVILSGKSEASYTVGPMVEEMLSYQKQLSDDEFSRALAKRLGLVDLRI